MKPTDASVREFIDAVPGAVRRRDAETLLALMERVTGETPRMWGPTIIGFGQYHYKYPSGLEGDAGGAGFAPRRAATTVYLPDGVQSYADELEGLGDFTTGVVCLYIKNFDRIDLSVLESIVSKSYRRVTAGTFEYRAADSGARQS